MMLKKTPSSSVFATGWTCTYLWYIFIHLLFFFSLNLCCTPLIFSLTINRITNFCLISYKTCYEKYISPTLKHRCTLLDMHELWGKRKLVKVDGKMNVAFYQKVLEGILHLSAQKQCMESTVMMIFHHDSNQKHKVILTL